MNKLKIFQDQKIRSHWDANEELWYFSIVDIIAALTESVDAGAYWRKLKERLKKEGNETVTNCHSLKMVAHDGKMRCYKRNQLKIITLINIQSNM